MSEHVLLHYSTMLSHAHLLIADPCNSQSIQSLIAADYASRLSPPCSLTDQKRDTI